MGNPKKKKLNENFSTIMALIFSISLTAILTVIEYHDRTLSATWKIHAYLGFLVIMVGSILGRIFDLNRRVARQDVLSKLDNHAARQDSLNHTKNTLYRAISNTTKSTTEIVKLAFQLPSFSINEESVKAITDAVTINIIQRINQRIFLSSSTSNDSPSSELVNYPIVVNAIINMLEGIGQEIERSNDNRGLPVERRVMTLGLEDNKYYARDYANFVKNSLDDSIEFRGISLMPPAMWMDKNDTFGLVDLLEKQKKRIEALKEEKRNPIFERVLLCPDELFETKEQVQLKKLTEIHKNMQVKFLMVHGSNFTYKHDYVSAEYEDFVLIKCIDRWFVLTSKGFNKLTRQNYLLESVENWKKKDKNMTAVNMLIKLFTDKYGSFVEGRLIYNEDVVYEYIRKWNNILRNFDKEKFILIDTESKKPQNDTSISDKN